jgi:hypothetical protein
MGKWCGLNLKLFALTLSSLYSADSLNSNDNKNKQDYTLLLQNYFELRSLVTFPNFMCFTNRKISKKNTNIKQQYISHNNRKINTVVLMIFWSKWICAWSSFLYHAQQAAYISKVIRGAGEENSGPWRRLSNTYCFSI